jgi:uncharacterized RDD family membrane protein YckC
MSEQPTFAGVWRRIVALAVDWALLAGLVFIFGLGLKPQYIALGPWGRAVGFVIAILYVGVCGSRLTDGQTVGKRLVDIRVVDRHGVPLSPGVAALRFLPLAIPFFLNRAQIGNTTPNLWLASFSSLTVFGLAGCAIYMFIVSGRSRRTINDLLVDSYVVRGSHMGPVNAPPLKSVHYAVCGIILLAAAISPVVGTPSAQTAQQAAEAKALRELVLSEPWVADASVVLGQITINPIKGSSSTTTYLAVRPQTRDPNVHDADRARALASRLVNADANLMSLDRIRIEPKYGYDMGVLSLWSKANHAFHPSDVLEPPPIP